LEAQSEGAAHQGFGFLGLVVAGGELVGMQVLSTLQT
jgi:hypothetical protein